MSPFGLIALATAALGMTAAVAQAGPPSDPESRYTQLHEARCVELRQAPGEEVGDELGKRCAGLGGIPVWIYYFDSTRLRIGFGRVGNVSGTFATDRRRGWPLEWRGHTVAGRFTPQAVIMRLRPPGDETPRTELVVWRLTPDGASCIVAHVPASPNQNARARAAADYPGDCEAAPDLLGR